MKNHRSSGQAWRGYDCALDDLSMENIIEKDTIKFELTIVDFFMATQKKQTKNSEWSIKSQLERLTQEKAICEYIWNAFDAAATEVFINVIPNGISGLSLIEISDNGVGIVYEEIDETFGQFLDSKKKIERSAITRGQKGKGRFSFCKFSDKAQWTSWRDSKEFTVTIVSTHLNEYEYTEPVKTQKKGSGVTVKFSPVQISEEKFIGDVVKYIQNDVSWLLVAKPKFKVIINSQSINPIDYSSQSEDLCLGDIKFNVKTVIWSQRPVFEQSYIYYLNSNGEIVYKELSELNKKGFDCSAYVYSDWFDEFSLKDDLISGYGRSPDSEEFKFASHHTKSKLREEYRLYKNNAADQLIQQYLTEGVFPEYKGDNRMINEFKRNQLIDTIKVIYEAEPQLFSNTLNKKQKKILIKLLDRIIETNNLSNLFDILDGIVSLSDREIDKLSSVIRRSSLSNITRTLSFINDRLDIIDYFKRVIYENKKIPMK